MRKRFWHAGWLVVVVPVLVAMLAPAGARAAQPPGLIDYQGVLRNAAGAPLTGTYDMVFRFFSAETEGVEILLDSHLAANAQSVPVAGGLFAVGLGSGQLADGAGPGVYASLAELFRDHDAVWLEVQVGAETLAPRTRVLATGYALNAAIATSSETLNGLPASFFLDTSSSRQWKSGALVLQNPDAGQAALDAVQMNGGADTAGYFANSAYTGRAWIAEGHRGLRASGDEYGGLFEAPFWGSSAYLARDNTGVWGNAGYRPGSCAGRFFGAYDGSGHNATLGCNGGVGVDGYGNPGGHFLSNWGYTGESNLGYFDDGVHGFGSWTGGYFVDLNSSGWTNVGYSTYKIAGSGSVSFVQNHPYEKGKVIVYAAPEGGEVAVYTRGTARLTGGVAHVKLDETFAMVANPDIGLSAHVTPIDTPIALAVSSRSTNELIVKGPAGSNAEFDYLVWGLRIGFESQSIVQPKHREALVPSMADHEALYAAEPSLRAFNALERFKGMADGRPWDDAVDLARAKTLLDAVGTYDPARDGSVRTLLGLPVLPSADGASASGVSSVAAGSGLATFAPPAITPGTEAASARAAVPRGTSASEPEKPEPSREVIERRPWIARLPATSRVEAGDVVVLDPAIAGAVRPCDGPADRGLVGVAVGRDLDGTVEVAVATILEVRVDASFGSIRPGDLLTTSETPGAAMRAEGAAATVPGTILGKALEALDTGIGTIRVLLIVR